MLSRDPRNVKAVGRHLQPNDMAVGQNQWYHFGVGAPLILGFFSGDWDVHWGYGFLDFDPWPHDNLLTVLTGKAGLDTNTPRYFGSVLTEQDCQARALLGTLNACRAQRRNVFFFFA